MADVTDTYTRQIRKPQDAISEQEEAERKASLQPSGLPPEELAGVALFREEFDSRTQSMGGEVFTASPVDTAIASIKSRAAASVEAAQATPEEKLGKAVADALVARGIVPERVPQIESGLSVSDASEDNDELYEQDEAQDEAEPEANAERYGWFDEAEGVWYRTDSQGNFLTGEDGKYATYPAGEFEPDADQGDEAVGDEEASNEDWAAVYDGSA